jgi:hypothetical protein
MELEGIPMRAMQTAALTFVLIGAFVALGCGDDGGTTPTDTNVVGDLGADTAGQIEAGADSQTGGDQGPGADSSGPGKATDVQLGLHDNEVKIKLDTMTVLGKEATDFDLYMNHDDGPNMYLGPGVTGQNLGNGTPFHQVDMAPDTGYQSDDTTSGTLVIGTSWRNGGSGTTGFIMTSNIYVVKLADNTYAKLEVLSAKSGEIHVLCYRQADGTRDIKTVP